MGYTGGNRHDALQASADTVGPTVRDPYEYFPGDPPIPELSVWIAAWLLGIAVGLWIVARLVGLRVLARVVGWGSIVAAAALLVSALPIVGRSLGNWGRLKSQLRGRHGDVLACAECSWPSRHDDTGPARWQFHFTPEHQPVRLFVRRTSPEPEILVDFGHGSVALFDLDTMVVLYSD